MRKKIITILLVVAMISICIPAISGVPEEDPTDEEVHKIVKKQMEDQSKGWLSIPNRNSNPADDNDDIAPELKQRYQYGLTNEFRVKYDIYSTNDAAFTDSWWDYY